MHRKAFQAAEAYVLGLFHLYFTVYFHKATRSAEAMLSAIIRKLGDLVKEDQIVRTALTADNPLIAFLRKPSLESFLRIDDFVLWSAMQMMSGAKDSELAELSARLLSRRLYKAIDVGVRYEGETAELAQFGLRLSKAKEAGEFGQIDVIEDRAKRNPYTRRGDDTQEALSQVLIRRVNGTSYMNLADASDVIKALRPNSIHRIYVRDGKTAEKIGHLIGGREK